MIETLALLLCTVKNIFQSLCMVVIYISTCIMNYKYNIFNFKQQSQSN